jgi:DNA-binding phage protein
MTLKTIPFDIVAELDSGEAIHEYLVQVFADGDADD